MSLFAHLAVRFGTHPENLATEALNYLLGRSTPARHGLLQMLRTAGGELPADLRFVTQLSTEDKGRPDLAGLDENGRALVLIEAKFWAGFTENQPLAYLDQLLPNGTLLVIGPHIRIAYLRRELLRRIHEGRRLLTESSDGSYLVDGRRLVVSSWRTMLAAIRLEAADDAQALADIGQLAGLCERMDEEAFLPVTSMELTSGVIRRCAEFGVIVDEVAALLSEEGVVSQKGLRPTGGNGWYGRYARLRGMNVFFHVNTQKWARLRPTPLWVNVFKANWSKGDSEVIRGALAPLETGSPGTVFTDEVGNTTVALHVPAGAERHEVVRAVADQLRALGTTLLPCVEPSAGDGQPSDSTP